MRNAQRLVGVRRDSGDAVLDLDFKDPLVRAYITDPFVVQIPDFVHSIDYLLSRNFPGFGEMSVITPIIVAFAIITLTSANRCAILIDSLVDALWSGPSCLSLRI